LVPIQIGFYFGDDTLPVPERIVYPAPERIVFPASQRIDCPAPERIVSPLHRG
jgi:hypothetical protein